MLLRFRNFGILLPLVAGLMVASATPAHAVGVGVVVFSGHANVSPLGSPQRSATFPNPVIKAAPPGQTWNFNSSILCTGVSVELLKPAPKFPADVRLGVPNPLGHPAVPTCNIAVGGGVLTAGEVQRTLDPATCAGTLVGCTPAAVVTGFGSGAFCGASGGRNGGGALSLDDVNGNPKVFALTNVGWIQSAATVIVVTGTITNTVTGNSGPLVALVDAVPDPTSPGGCDSVLNSKNAVRFIVVGVAIGIL